jgi:hypothetical protein
MRIAFDMDGVVADLHTAFSAAAVRMFPDLDTRAMASADVGASPPADAGANAEGLGAEPPTEIPDATAGQLPLTRRQTGAVWDRLCAVPDFWETLPETEPGIVRRIATVAETRRWEVIFVTSRPSTAGTTVQRQSQRWLTAHGFSLPSVFVVHGSRGRIADALALDVVVDDRPDNCLDVVLESKARAILVWRADKTRIPASAKRLGIGSVSSVEACLTVLTEADRSSSSPADLLQRLRRLLGLTTKPAVDSKD